MKFYALNGSPRRGQSTNKLLNEAICGIKSVIADADVETIHVYDYLYTGCVSCYACKRIGGKSYGKCAKKDDISEILLKISEADGIVIGAPIYFHDVPGQLRAFMERLLYPYLVYGKEYYSIAPKKIPIAFIYTMNATEEKMRHMNYQIKLSALEEYAGIVFSTPEIMYCNDTVQFDNYKLYMSERFSEEEKLRRRKEFFPEDCNKAYALGQRMAEKVKCQRPTA